MFYNYLKTAWRNLIKEKTYSTINIFGMGLGIGTCLLIMLFVKEEWNFDQFHTKNDRIYRAWVKEHFKGDIFFNSITPYLLGTELRDNFPEIDRVSRYTTINSLIKREGQIEEESVHLADPTFFEVFDFDFVSGSDDFLKDLHSLALSEKVAKKYFGERDPMGENLTLQVGGEWTDFTVSGVLEDPPNNSSIQYGMVIPFENTTSYMSEFGRQCWTCVSVETYVLLDEKNDITTLEKVIAPFIDKQVAEDYDPGEYIIGFQPLADIHLNNEIPQGIVNVSDSRYPYILAGIGLLILLLACINFTTLSLGRSVSRSKEVGIRKVTGATRKQLMMQFWSEACMTVGIGVALGLLIAVVGLPFFNQLADKTLVLRIEPVVIGGLLALFLVTGILSGLYPALVLSGFKPIQALKMGRGPVHYSKSSILSWLVGFQFVLSVVLIICSGMMQNQMKYLQKKNLGFNQSQVITIPYKVSGQNLFDMWEDGLKLHMRLKDQLTQDPSIHSITTSSHTFGTQGWLTLGFTDKEEERFKSFSALKVDEEFVPTMEIPLQAGRNFDREMTSDTRTVIINPAFAREFGLSEPVGSYLPEPFNDYQVIGVTEDFHFTSLHNPIEPLVMAYDFSALVQAAPDISYIDQPNPKFSLKLSSENLPVTIREIERVWTEIAPDQSFVFSFLDDDIGFQYQEETKLGAIVNWATILALLIACLGLFGISALKIAFKTKEIGIRKVLGASSSGILYWLSIDYVRLIFLATLVAVPLAWFAMQRWLQDFAFNVGIQWWVFVLAAALTTAIALLTVGVQSLRASWANPVDSLRTE